MFCLCLTHDHKTPALKTIKNIMNSYPYSRLFRDVTIHFRSTTHYTLKYAAYMGLEQMALLNKQ